MPTRLESLISRVPALRRQARERAENLAQTVARPKKFDQFAQGIQRIEQIMSLLFLGPVIVINLTLIVVWNELLATVLLGPGGAESFNDVMAFLVTAITLGTFILSAWVWFQFVRTGAFGFFKLDD